MRIVVTGSNGYVGSNIVEKLKSSNQIIGIGLSEKSIHDDINYIQSDLSLNFEYLRLAEHIGNCDVMIHTSANLSKDSYSKELIDVNCFGSLNITELCKLIKPKLLVNISSIPIIGKPNELPIKENHSNNPQTLYHLTKLFAEKAISFVSNEGINFINLRIPSPVGMNMKVNSILPIFVTKAMQNEPIVLSGNGGRRQNYIDVRDIADCIQTIISRNLNVSGLFNIGSYNTISNLELASLCIHLLNSKSTIEYNGKPDPEEELNWNIDSTKLITTFNYENKYSIEKSILSVRDYLETIQ